MVIIIFFFSFVSFILFYMDGIWLAAPRFQFSWKERQLLLVGISLNGETGGLSFRMSESRLAGHRSGRYLLHSSYVYDL